MLVYFLDHNSNYDIETKLKWMNNNDNINKNICVMSHCLKK